MAQQGVGDGDVESADESGLEEVADGGGAAADANQRSSLVVPSPEVSSRTRSRSARAATIRRSPVLRVLWCLVGVWSIVEAWAFGLEGHSERWPTRPRWFGSGLTGSDGREVVK